LDEAGIDYPIPLTPDSVIKIKQIVAEAEKRKPSKILEYRFEQ
jgi:hypothetical protein